MGKAPDALLRLVEGRDITEFGSANSDCVPSPADRKACPERSRRVFQSHDYKEEQLRAEFLNAPSLTVRHSVFVIRTFHGPFFTALGWDMDNKQGLSETFKQVIHVLRPAQFLESIKVACATKAPGCTFRIGGHGVVAQRRQAANHKPQAVRKVRIAR